MKEKPRKGKNGNVVLNEIFWISWEIRLWSAGKRYSDPLFIQQASGQIFQDDVEDFVSTFDIFFMLHGHQRTVGVLVHTLKDLPICKGFCNEINVFKVLKIIVVFYVCISTDDLHHFWLSFLEVQM